MRDIRSTGEAEQRMQAVKRCGGRASWTLHRRRHRGFRTNQFVETHGHRLAEVHGIVRLAGGNVNQMMAVADLFAGEAILFRSKDECGGARSHRFAEGNRALLQAIDRRLQRAGRGAGGANHERGIAHRLRQARVLSRLAQNVSRIQPGAGFLHRGPVWIHQAEIREPEI